MSESLYISENILFQSDCIYLMESLLRTHQGKIKLIYLDPPRVSSSSLELMHYLDMISKVIQLSRELLRDDGGLIFHTDPFVTSTIRFLLDHFFGVDNFREEFIWPIKQFGKHRKTIHDILWFYSRNNNYTYNPPIKYLNDGTNSNELFHFNSLVIKGDRPTFQFSWHSYSPPPGFSWRVSRERLDQLYKEDLIFFPSAGELPRQKALTRQVEVEVGSVWNDIPPLASSSQEDLGFVGQKPLALLHRIISLGSEPEDLFLDPFCGSGTSLIAAQKLGRFWIGSDIAPEAISMCIKRLNALKLKAGSDFFIGSLIDYVANSSVEIIYSDLLSGSQLLSYLLEDSGARLKDIKDQLQENVVTDHKEILEAFVITEGKTDWKHLKAALTNRKLAGKFVNLCIEFLEYEDEQDFKMGNDQLLKLCIKLSKIPQYRPTIFIFDRDEESFVKKSSEAENNYRRWGNNVFSMVLPVPEHRQKTPEVCIELYYIDKDLKRHDSQNRRIFINTEFLRKSGAHRNKPLFCRDNAVNDSRLSIIDKEVYNRKGENVALSKNDFAEHILKQDMQFNNMTFSSFDPIFELLEEIIAESKAL